MTTTGQEGTEGATVAPVHIGAHAARTPERPATIEGASGRIRTFAELEDRSARLAHFLAASGLQPASRVAAVLGNGLDYLDVAWATQRSGLYLTPVNWHLTAAEAAYIVTDSGAGALICSPRLADLAPPEDTPLAAPAIRLLTAGPAPGPGADDAGAAGPEEGRPEGFVELETVLRQTPSRPVRPELEGSLMFYSSGTTGRPKGILRRWSPVPYGTPQMLDRLMAAVYGFSADTVYLCPAPMYHAAPLAWSIGAQRLGATVVVMERFEPLEALRLIERYRVTHVQMVPTMFVRLLKLSDEDRHRYDLSSLQRVIHAAAPCPVEVKAKMLDWWGPIIEEYYASSEGNGLTAISPEEWRARPGSVGRPLLGKVHIVDERGEELPSGEIGTVYFESPSTFEYHNDPVKTADAYDRRGWSTVGDMGRLDADGYLYLSDRRTNLIISGGVNIYPQEVENELTLHPAVADVAVIGVPDEEMGQRVLAVVQPADGALAGPQLETELLDYLRSRIAHYKCPRSVDFVDELPRLATGKLAKRLLLERYTAQT